MSSVYCHTSTDISYALLEVANRRKMNQPWLLRNSRQGLGFITLDYWNPTTLDVDSVRYFFNIELMTWSIVQSGDTKKLRKTVPVIDFGKRNALIKAMQQPAQIQLLLTLILDQKLDLNEQLIPLAIESEPEYIGYGRMKALFDIREALESTPKKSSESSSESPVKVEDSVESDESSEESSRESSSPESSDDDDSEDERMIYQAHHSHSI